MSYKIYLAGPITGCSFEGATSWREEVTSTIDSRIECFSPLREKIHLATEGSIRDCYPSHLLSSQRGIFARDRFDVERSDLVFVNLLGAKIVSIGTMFEIAWAHELHIPLVLCMETAGNIHDHAFVRESCPLWVHSLREGIEVTQKILLPSLSNLHI